MQQIKTKYKKNKIRKAAVISGGASRAFFFHLGALSEIGFDNIDALVGSSAGSVMSLAIAAGFSEEEIEDAIREEKEQIYSKTLDRCIKKPKIAQLFSPNFDGYKNFWIEQFKSFFNFPQLLSNIFHTRDSIEYISKKFYESTQSITGMCTGEELERYVHEILPEDSFNALKKDLYIIATQLDTGKRVVFNAHRAEVTDNAIYINDVPPSKAIVASCALPPLFEPYNINGTYYIDGEIKKLLSVDVGADICDEIYVCYTHQPLYRNDGGTVYDMGLGNILRQSIFIMLSDKIEHWKEIYKERYPHKKIFWISPDPADKEFFNTFDFASNKDDALFLIEAGKRACRKALVA